MVKSLIGAIKRKTSMHRIFNHKYTFLYFSIQNNTIYSHVKVVYKIHKISSYTHEESQLHICISDRCSLVCRLKSYINCMKIAIVKKSLLLLHQSIRMQNFRQIQMIIYKNCLKIKSCLRFPFFSPSDVLLCLRRKYFNLIIFSKKKKDQINLL